MRFQGRNLVLSTPDIVRCCLCEGLVDSPRAFFNVVVVREGSGRCSATVTTKCLACVDAARDSEVVVNVGQPRVEG